jgi:hypothetical protein
MAHDLMMIALGWAIPGFLGWLLTKIPPIQKWLLAHPPIAVAGVCCLFSVLSSITAVFVYDRFFVQQMYVSDVINRVTCGGMGNPLPGPYNDANGWGNNINTCSVKFPQKFKNAKVFLTMTGFDIVHTSNFNQNNQAVVGISATDQNEEGFNLTVASNIDESIHGVRIGYIVFYQR